MVMLCGITQIKYVARLLGVGWNLLMIMNFWFRTKRPTLMNQLLDAEREARASRTPATPSDPTFLPNEQQSDLSPEEESRYRRLVAILRYPLDGTSLPSESDLQALSEYDRERLEYCARLAAWDRFWRRDQIAPESIIE
jgi:hypothetical protein